MSELYRDPWITCTEDAILIRWYYLWGAKRIPYTAIRSAERVPLAPVRGRGRIWGTANVRYWASLDPGRPRKKTGLILDLGRAVRPFITPDDTDAVADIIQERARLSGIPLRERGPVI